MTTRTLTDNRALEALLDERWCHVLDATTGVTLCGKTGLGGGAEKLHRSHVDTNYCSDCGLRNCPDCALAYRERGR